MQVARRVGKYAAKSRAAASTAADADGTRADS